MNKLTLPLAVGLLAVLLVVFSNAPAETPRQDDEDAEEPSALELDPFTFDDWPMSKAAARGAEAYKRRCAGCHGDDGRGMGPAAEFLNPLPRDFQKGNYKFRTTGSGQVPSREDLMKTITCGLPGSSMPSFRLVPEPQRQDIVSYLLYLTSFGKARTQVQYYVEADEMTTQEIREQKLDEIRESVREEFARAQPIPIPPEPARTPESIARGRERYMNECAACHGATGRGDGKSSFTLRDWKDAEIIPRDFTTGVFRAGNTGRDLFLRLRGGLNGTPMPSTSGDDADLWALVHFIQTLVTSRNPTLEKHGCAHGEEGR